MLIVATSLVTGKPLKEAQYLVDAGWDKLTLLKPNVLTIYDSEAQVLQVAQGQATIGGIEYSKSDLSPHRQGAAARHDLPQGRRVHRHQQHDDRQECAGAGTGCRLHQPHSGAVGCNKMLSEQTLSAPSVSGIDFKPENGKIPRLSRYQGDGSRALHPGLEFHRSAPRPVAGAL